MKHRNWFVIRADSDEYIGIGHVMRCLALAEWATELAIRPILFTKSASNFIINKVSELGGEVILLPTVNRTSSNDYQHSSWLEGTELEDAQLCKQEIQTLLTINENKYPLFIMVDHYSLASPWERYLKNFAPILVIDDLNDRSHDCSWLVDQTHDKSDIEYINLAPKNCHFFIGSKFALLRKEFSDHTQKTIRTFPEKKVKILITLGGVDKNNDTARIAKYVLNNNFGKDVSQTLVSGSINPNLQELKMLAENNPNIRVIVDEKSMAKLMSAHDICIGAAGSTSWERCAMSLPTITVSIAENQKVIAKNLDISHATINLGEIDQLTEKGLISTISHIIENRTLFQSLVTNSRNLCDGLGCQRILREVIK